MAMEIDFSSAFAAVERRANQSAELSEGNTLLHVAMMYFRWLPEAKTRQHSAEDLTHRNARGQIPLHLAAMQGSPSAVHVLIDLRSMDAEQGGEEALKQMLRMTDANGDTALHLALRNNHNNFASEKIDYDGEVLSDLVNNKGESPNHEKIASELIDYDGEGLRDLVNNKGESPLYLAACKGMSSIVKRLLEVAPSSPSNYRGPGNTTALHVAALRGDIVTAEELLKKRAGMDKEADESGQIPLHCAVYGEEEEMVEFLLNHDPLTGYYKDKNGNMAIHIATLVDNEEIWTHISSQCLDSLFAVNENSECILHIILRKSSPELGASFFRRRELWWMINHQDKNGNTPLHAAILADSYSPLLFYLVQSGAADPWVQNNDGKTAMQLFNSVRTKLDAKTAFEDLFRSFMQKEYQQMINMTKETTNHRGDERKRHMQLSEKYAGNVSLVASVMATITFAAAFTVPGGFSSDEGDKGKVVLSQNVALRVFLISDTISMCASLLLAYLLSSSKIFKNPILFYDTYRFFSKWLMSISFGGAWIAFGTGMYAVLAPKCTWLGILICIMCSISPFIAWALDGNWEFLLNWALDNWEFLMAKLMSKFVGSNGLKRTNN